MTGSGLFLDHSGCPLIASLIYDGNARLYDTGLLISNLFHGIAQIFRMIQTYGSDGYCQRMTDHIRRVQPSAESRLQNREIIIHLVKQLHTHVKQEFKIGWMAVSLFRHTFR